MKLFVAKLMSESNQKIVLSNVPSDTDNTLVQKDLTKGDIYMITSPSGKQYIGQCVQYLSNEKPWGYTNRFKSHLRDAEIGKDYCRLLNNAIRKYGADALKLERLLICDISELNEKEAYYIKHYNTISPNGYNLTTGGGVNSRQSDETKCLRSQSMIGKNKGNIYPGKDRIRSDDKTLPKYLLSYKDHTGKTGYRVSHHPVLKDKFFVGKYMSSEEKLKLATDYLNSATKQV